MIAHMSQALAIFAITHLHHVKHWAIVQHVHGRMTANVDNQMSTQRRLNKNSIIIMIFMSLERRHDDDKEDEREVTERTKLLLYLLSLLYLSWLFILSLIVYSLALSLSISLLSHIIIVFLSCLSCHCHLPLFSLTSFWSTSPILLFYVLHLLSQ